VSAASHRTDEARPSLVVPRPAAPGRVAPGRREPSFDELVTGAGRHRDADASPRSALGRLALRARLVPTPAGHRSGRTAPAR
jgi:hypothetical protein